MEIKLIGAIDYDKLESELKKRNANLDIIQLVKDLEVERRSHIVSAAGRLSRFPKDVFEILDITENNSLEKNTKFIERVTKMGHDSITDHDYVVFALKNVSIMLEQEIIKERYASFTIKSRREVDFSDAGIYIPNFHDKNREVLKENECIKKKYTNHMQDLFQDYTYFIENGILNEDARFIMPYCTYSNIFMGIDAHTLKDMIKRFTKTKYSNVEELRDFGEKLKEIAKQNIPYIIEEIDSTKEELVDPVDEYLESKVPDLEKKYKVIKRAELLNRTSNVDDTILIASIMRRFQLDKIKATKVYRELCIENPNFKKELMRKIVLESDGLELSQISFDFQIPLSYAVLTHLARHRCQKIIIPDVFSDIDLTQYKIPPKISSGFLDYYKSIHAKNLDVYEHFKNNYQICNEDLIYFILLGNKINVLSSMDGQALKHILSLRKCNKSQWETRGMAYGVHEGVKKLEDAKIFASLLGASCQTKDICNEGKECCGKILKLRKQKVANLNDN